jgi:hypothetical protein
MSGRIGRECSPSVATALPDVGAWVQYPDLKELLQLFLDQSWPIRSIVVGSPQACPSQDAALATVGRGPGAALLLRLLAGKDASSPPIVARVPLQTLGHSPSGVAPTAAKTSPNKRDGFQATGPVTTCSCGPPTPSMR